jgi:hypothetical protein
VVGVFLDRTGTLGWNGLGLNRFDRATERFRFTAGTNTAAPVSAMTVSPLDLQTVRERYGSERAPG